MKTVILEVLDDVAICLLENGDIKKIENNNYFVGQEIKTKENVSFRLLKPLLTVAASLAFIFTGTYALLNIPTSYVTLDVNPSFEYACNIFNKVIDVESINEDAEKLVNDIEGKYQNIDVAINKTVHALAQNGYLNSEENDEILIAASGYIKEYSQKLLSDAVTYTNQAALSNGIKPTIISFNTSIQEHDEAKKLGTTSGKMALIMQYNDSVQGKDGAIPFSDMVKKSVSDIVICINNKLTNDDESIKNPSLLTVADDSTKSEDENTLKDEDAKNNADKENSDKNSSNDNNSQVDDKDKNDKNDSKNNDINQGGNDEDVIIPPNDKPSSINDNPKEENNSKDETSKPENKPEADTKPEEKPSDSSNSETKPNKDDDKQYAPDFGLDDTIDDGLSI